MHDHLLISELSVSTQIGVYAWEQRIRQPLLIDLQIPLNIANCEDNLQKTLDYDALCKDITQFVSSKSFLLIETVAEEVALRIKEQFNVQKVTVCISKPLAIKNAKNVKISITR